MSEVKDTTTPPARQPIMGCPFCGRRMVCGSDRFYRHGFQRRGALCVAESIRVYAGDEQAIAAWNRRSGDST